MVGEFEGLLSMFFTSVLKARPATRAGGLECKGAKECIVKSFCFRSMLVQTSWLAYSLME